jgi:transcriptional regulator with XRE-family HTH domain
MKRNNVISIERKRSFTTAESMIDDVREVILRSGQTYSQLSISVGCSQSTINNLASGKTRWPRPTTLFPLLVALRIHLTLTKY